MIEMLQDMPEGVLGFEAVGKVEPNDYKEVFEPAINGSDNVKLVYVLGGRFDGYTAGAAWEDFKVGFSNLKKWKRIAVVTDTRWIKDGTTAVGWMMPGECKTFSLDDRDEAISWASED